MCRVFAFLAVATLAMVAVSARADTIYDDFNGTSLDTTKWSTAYNHDPVYITEAGGSLTLLPDPSSYTEIDPGSNVWAVTDPVGQGIWNFKIGADFTGGIYQFGLTDANSNAYASVWHDGFLYERGPSDGYTSHHGTVALPLPKAGDLWTIQVTSSATSVSVNGTMLDSIPNVPGLSLGFQAAASQNWYQGSGVVLDYVSIGPAVPEPSSLVLLACGAIGLLCYAWRKRR
jgi:hypothetical protein